MFMSLKMQSQIYTALQSAKRLKALLKRIKSKITIIIKRSKEIFTKIYKIKV